MGRYDDIAGYKQLLDDGVITQSEFEKMKLDALSGATPPPRGAETKGKPLLIASARLLFTCSGLRFVALYVALYSYGLYGYGLFQLLTDFLVPALVPVLAGVLALVSVRNQKLPGVTAILAAAAPCLSSAVSLVWFALFLRVLRVGSELSAYYTLSLLLSAAVLVLVAIQARSRKRLPLHIPVAVVLVVRLAFPLFGISTGALTVFAGVMLAGAIFLLSLSLYRNKAAYGGAGTAAGPANLKPREVPKRSAEPVRPESNWYDE